MLSSLLKEVGDRQFKYGEWDCFQLLKYVHISNNRYFPEIELSEIYQNYNEKNFPDHLIINLLKEHCIQVEIGENFDIVYMIFNNLPALGTYHNKNIIYMGSDRMVVTPGNILSSYIDSFWRIKNV